MRILDVGGTQNFWEMMEFLPGDDCHITLLNLEAPLVSLPHFQSMAGDAREMPQFADREFDVVFSNSVIEHVGGYDDQRRMAAEIKRVGQRYFLQTPNKYFPVEPHFLIPLFHFLPARTRIWLLTHFSLGRIGRISDREMARRRVEGIRLLSKREVVQLFPEASLYEERVYGLAKSFVVYAGWDWDDEEGWR